MLIQINYIDFFFIFFKYGLFGPGASLSLYGPADFSLARSIFLMFFLVFCLALELQYLAISPADVNKQTLTEKMALATHNALCNHTAFQALLERSLNSAIGLLNA